MILIIDNYDSFTFNLVQCVGALGFGHALRVVRNDACRVEEVKTWRPARIIISPGPGRPEESGISMEIVRRLAGRVPILGVCLGHQCIVQAFGGRIERAPRLMHGKTSAVYHRGVGVFAGLPSPLTVMRYHSLLATRDCLPDCLAATAWTQQGEVMGVRHQTLPVEGVQFHPESFLTEHGTAMLRRFILSGAGSIDRTTPLRRIPAAGRWVWRRATVEARP